MAQRNLGAAEFFCDAIEDAAAQTGAQRTDVFARRDELLRDRVGVLIFDVISHALFLEPGFEQVRGTARNMLVDVHSDDVKVHRSTSLEFQKRIKQHVAVLSAAHGNGDFVAVFDHAVVGAGHCAQAHDAFFEFSHRNGGFDVLAGCDFDEFGFFGAAFGHAYQTHGNVGGVVFGHDR